MTNHYFDAELAGEGKTQQIEVDVWGQEFSLQTSSGVFANGRLDIGTAVLLKNQTPPATGKILDLGCGYGVIGLAIALASPQVQVHGVEVNPRAIRLANQNASQLGVADRYQAGLAADFVDTEYHEIWSNPPIRIGKPALHELLLTWLPKLAPTGVARLVVGKNLGADSLAIWLESQGYQCSKVASGKGFRVLEVRRG